jgi:hypothetical protein
MIMLNDHNNVFYEHPKIERFCYDKRGCKAPERRKKEAGIICQRTQGKETGKKAEQTKLINRVNC